MSIFTGFSDSDANGILNTWMAGASSVAPSNWYVGLLTALPTSSLGAGATEPWLSPPTISLVTSASVGGSIPSGNRYYKVTSVNASGESIASSEYTYNVPAGTSTNTVTPSWGAVAGASVYSVYAASVSGAEGLIASGRRHDVLQRHRRALRCLAAGGQRHGVWVREGRGCSQRHELPARS